MQTVSLIGLFIGSTGGFAAHKTLFQNTFISSEWHRSLLQYLTQLHKIMYPLHVYLDRFLNKIRVS